MYANSPKKLTAKQLDKLNAVNKKGNPYIMPVNDKLAIMGVWFLLLLIIGGTIGVPNIPKVFMWVVGGISVGTLAWSLKISIVGR